LLFLHHEIAIFKGRPVEDLQRNPQKNNPKKRYKIDGENGAKVDKNTKKTAFAKTTQKTFQKWSPGMPFWRPGRAGRTQKSIKS